MNIFRPGLLILLGCTAFACTADKLIHTEIDPPGRGPYAVGSTNMEVAPEYAGVGDETMHEYLLGRPDGSDRSRYVADILKYPESAWIVDVPVPDESAVYGPASGQSLPVVTFLTYPSSEQQKNRYAFPYHDAKYGIFENMLGAGDQPRFADPGERYPLIILSHGGSAHGIYDVRHAHNLSSHGYIVAVVFYGDDRTGVADSPNHHVSFLRPLLTKAVLDSILGSETFGDHVDPRKIGISGHSFGGFTALAIAGGRYLGDEATVSDKRITAAVIAAPAVGGKREGGDFFVFGPGNNELGRVTAPVLCFFGTNDDVTLASFILPATQRLSGPTYVVELVDQPHVFEQGSWEDRDNWELLFFSAYLKNDPASLETLETARSMKGGNEDLQLFDYQRLPVEAGEGGPPEDRLPP